MGTFLFTFKDAPCDLYLNFS
uniref:Uncharacterized protein n=1 Tax=Rhizophora mucronata TaxID=61149 RepID=A0A2P2N9K5_RHIMU